MPQSGLLRLEGWALILGASSGFGEAISLALARAGMHIAGVHLDRRAGLDNVERIRASIEAYGQQARFFNINAADPKRREATLDALAELVDPRANESAGVRVLVHSIAFGTLKPFYQTGLAADELITQKNLDMTSDVMAHSLVYWTQGLASRKLFGPHARIFAMTSSGNTQVYPGYGAVSAAKVALEAHIRQLAVELAPLGVTANALCAGVTDTPALRKIPGHETMIQYAKARSPHQRLTTPQDVANAVVALATPATDWMTGNTIRLDGGENVSG